MPGLPVTLATRVRTASDTPLTTTPPCRAPLDASPASPRMPALKVESTALNACPGRLLPTCVPTALRTGCAPALRVFQRVVAAVRALRAMVPAEVRAAAATPCTYVLPGSRAAALPSPASTGRPAARATPPTSLAAGPTATPSTPSVIRLLALMS